MLTHDIRFVKRTRHSYTVNSVDLRIKCSPKREFTEVLHFTCLYLASDPSLCSTVAFLRLGNSDAISVSIDFPISSKGGFLFQYRTFHYSYTYWNDSSAIIAGMFYKRYI